MCSDRIARVDGGPEETAPSTMAPSDYSVASACHSSGFDRRRVPWRHSPRRPPPSSGPPAPPRASPPGGVAGTPRTSLSAPPGFNSQTLRLEIRSRTPTATRSISTRPRGTGTERRRPGRPGSGNALPGGRRTPIQGVRHRKKQDTRKTQKLPVSPIARHGRAAPASTAAGRRPPLPPFRREKQAARRRSPPPPKRLR